MRFRCRVDTARGSMLSVVKRPVFGRCNICLKESRLTWDHVPPKSAIKVSPVQIRQVANLLQAAGADFVSNQYTSSTDIRTSLRLSQNGLKFRTLCGRCNNTLLGGRYDVELARVSNEVARWLQRWVDLGLRWLPPIVVSVQTHLLLRAVSGHLLAAQADSPPAPFHDHLREYFLDESRPLPPALRLFWWLFPSNIQVVIPALGVANNKGRGFLAGDLLKFFPLAYYIAEPHGLELETARISGAGCTDMECVTKLQLDLRRIPAFDWPEAPSEEHDVAMPPALALCASQRTRK
jgi:hypothetical protein